MGNTADSALTDHRRELVSRLKCRGLSVREITARLPKISYIDPETGRETPTINPDTGKPWSRACIQKDIDFIREQWRTRATESADEVFNRQLAELDEAIRSAWEMNDIALVMRGLKDRRELLGLGSKTLKLEHSIDGDEMPPLISMEALDIDQLTAIVEAHRIAGPTPNGGGVAGASHAGKPTGDIIQIGESSGADAGSA